MRDISILRKAEKELDFLFKKLYDIAMIKIKEFIDKLFRKKTKNSAYFVDLADKNGRLLPALVFAENINAAVLASRLYEANGVRVLEVRQLNNDDRILVLNRRAKGEIQ